MDFEIFWDLFDPGTDFLNRRSAARHLWEETPADKQKAIIEWLRQHGPYKNRNPYFFIQDFKAQRTLQMSFDDYYNRYHTTEDRDGWHRVFLEAEHKTIYVKNTTITGSSPNHNPTTL